MMLGRCLVCGAEHAACGAPAGAAGFEILEAEKTMAGPLKVYETEVHGHKALLRLNDADARRMGLLDEEPAPDAEPVKRPARKSAKPPNKALTPEGKGDRGPSGLDG